MISPNQSTSKSTRDSPAPHGEGASSGRIDGGAIRVPLQCPTCGASGLVEWSKLSRAIDCPKCSCRFVFRKDAGCIALAELPQVEYRCPRCSQHSSTAVQAARNGFACSTCGLSLALGPEGTVLEQVEAIRQKMRSSADKGRPVALGERLTDVRSWIRRHPRTSLGAIASLVLVASWVVSAIVPLLDRSPTALAVRMVRRCLAGDESGAARFIPDDAVQQVMFEQWRLRYMTNIQDRYRPAGDRALVVAEIESESEANCQMTVCVKSKSLGERRFLVNWTQIAGNWYFDAVATLTPPSTTATGATEARPRSLPASPIPRIPTLVPSQP